MKGVYRKELNNATIVTYALVMALFDELDDPSKRRVAVRALTYMPPKPDPHLPTDEAMWRDAQLCLESLTKVSGP